MDFASLLTQVLNGVQLGLLLFLIASGLTLIFGIMNVINLAHGSLFMVGAYIAYVCASAFGSLWFALPVAIAGGLLLGALLERSLFRFFYAREHLYQVLLTFALVLLFEEARAFLVDNDFHAVPVPAVLDFSVPVVLELQLLGLSPLRAGALPAAGRPASSSSSSARASARWSARRPSTARWSRRWAST